MSAPDILFSTTLLVECLNAAGWSSTTDNGWRKLAAVREKLLAEFDAALARAESATPAKHQDAERLDWLEQNTVTLYCSGLYDMSSDAAVEVPGLGTFTGETLRAAIDAARKQGGES